MNTRPIIIALVATGAGALAGPPVVAVAKNVAQQVIVQNTAENPVVTKATGTTDVSGTVGLAGGTSVKLADGSVVGLADGSKVSLTDNTVRLADGSAFKLADGSTVQLAAGSLVGLADGTKVALDGPVTIADGATVALADDTTVQVGNSDANPVPVKIVGGGGGGGSAPASFQVFGFNRSLAITPSQPGGNHYAGSYTVPAGKVLVLTLANGYASEGIRLIGLERRTCNHSAGSGGHYSYGILVEGTLGTWHSQGEIRSPAGCEIVPFFNVAPTRSQTVDATFHLFGDLVDAP